MTINITYCDVREQLGLGMFDRGFAAHMCIQCTFDTVGDVTESGTLTSQCLMFKPCSPASVHCAKGGDVRSR